MYLQEQESKKQCKEQLCWSWEKEIEELVTLWRHEIWATVEQPSVRRALENKEVSTVKPWVDRSVDFGEDWIQKAER